MPLCLAWVAQVFGEVLYTCMWIYVHVCVHVHVCVYMFMFMYMYMYANICLCLCTCTCMCVYGYIHTREQTWFHPRSSSGFIWGPTALLSRLNITSSRCGEEREEPLAWGLPSLFLYMYCVLKYMEYICINTYAYISVYIYIHIHSSTMCCARFLLVYICIYAHVYMHLYM